MNNEFMPADIVWVKNVSDRNDGVAYIPIGEKFHLHFPDGVGWNIESPRVNEIILLRQTLPGRGRVFTHLVSPVSNEVAYPENSDPGYRRAREVQVIAITPLNNPIFVQHTNFAHLRTRGNACHIENIRVADDCPSPDEYLQIQEDIWRAFEPHFRGVHKISHARIE